MRRIYRCATACLVVVPLATTAIDAKPSEREALRTELAALKEEAKSIGQRIRQLESELQSQPSRRLRIEEVIVIRFSHGQARSLCESLSMNWPDNINGEFRVMAKIVDVSPTGKLAVFGQRTYRVDNHLYQYELSGTVDRGNLNDQRQIDASEVADLLIDTRRLRNR